jgi:hypothetical protein
MGSDPRPGIVMVLAMANRNGYFSIRILKNREIRLIISYIAAVYVCESLPDHGKLKKCDFVLCSVHHLKTAGWGCWKTSEKWLKIYMGWRVIKILQKDEFLK